MGIRFYCPTGHKLNVKSFLAGKRGICPHCQSKFEIPSESDPKLLAGDSSRLMEAVAGLPNESGVDLSNIPVVPADNSTSSSSATPTLAAANAASTVTVPPASHHDPIADAPHAIWYVRPPSGGQFGPATGDIMRTWIGEGRVPKDALVWREGWPEWQTASDLFPGLAHSTVQAVPTSAASGGDFPQIVTEAAGEIQVAARVQHRKSRKSNNLIVGALIIACVCLFFVLLSVLRR